MFIRTTQLPTLALAYTVLCCAHATSAQAPVATRAFASQFIQQNCADCHVGEDAEGGFQLNDLGSDLTSTADFSRWVQVWDVVSEAKMPPKEAKLPAASTRDKFLLELGNRLTIAHVQSKGAVLRRLNRNEFQNTLNDLFGTNLQLASLLPEDGKSGEFDNVGSSLNVSLVHMQRYMDAAEQVLDSSIASRTAPPEVTLSEYGYANGDDGERFIGNKWLKLEDDSVVFFQNFGYPSGLLRESRIKEQSGYYKIRVTGYAYQSDKPVTFSLGGESYARGSEKPIFGHYSFTPGEPQTIEIEVWMEKGYMVKINAYGIYDLLYAIKNHGVENYKGPGIAISKVEVQGPIVHEFPSRGHKLIFSQLSRMEVEPPNPADKQKRYYKPTFKVQLTDELADVVKALQTIAENLFRRSVEPAELKLFIDLYQSERDADETVESAYRAAIVALMCSPEFLFFKEQPGKLNSHAVASRLSYFLTRSLPDSRLIELAENGQLIKNDVVVQQANRLMASHHFARFLRDFCGAWLNLRELDFTMPDKRLFPEFDRYLRESMEQETYAYLRTCLQENRAIESVVKSDFAMLNDRLADHYGIDGVTGSEIRKVPLPQNNIRGGFLSQAAVMKVSANGTNTSPVVRGVYVSQRILGIHPSPPPPNIDGIEPDIRGAQTLREILTKHRNVESCQNCHRLIDAPGFALESFNPIGGFRDYYRSNGDGEKVVIYVDGRKTQYRIGRDVDASGELINGQEFDGYRQFRDHLASDPERLATTFVRKLLTFATGRELGFSDREAIARIVASTKASRYGMRDLLLASVTSTIFLEK